MKTTETKEKAEEKKGRERRIHGAKERCEAVLAVWTERRRPSQVCRQMGITEGVLLNWQDRAMRGMLEALEPRARTAEGHGPWLPPKLEEKLRLKAAENAARQTRLSKRLAKIRDGEKKEEEKTG